MRRLLLLTVLIILTVCPQWAALSASPKRVPASDGPEEKQMAALRAKLEKEKSQPSRAKLAFAIGVLAYKKGDPEQARDGFLQAITLGTILDDYAEYYLGLLDRDAGNHDEAKKHFEHVLEHRPSSIRAFDADIELARIAKIKNRYGEAIDRLRVLKRRTRGTATYPTVLMDLTESLQVKGRKAEACREALLVFSRYPVDVLNHGWGDDSKALKTAAGSLSCPLLYKDRDRRYQNLRASGAFNQLESELIRWETEIKSAKRSGDEDLLHLQQHQALLLMIRGRVSEALNLLTKAKEASPKDFTTQMLYARALAQSDSNSAAVGAYIKAFELGPRSRLGSKALFQAAFLCYQNKDYDGASRNFTKLLDLRVKKSMKSDARWHLAWIRYLKSDYEGALKLFTTLLDDLRKHSRNSVVDIEKLQYWTAMALLRQGETEKAKSMFADLGLSKRNGYYAFAARARLSTLGGIPIVPSSTTSPDGNRNPANVAERAEEPADAVDGPDAEEDSGEESVGAAEPGDLPQVTSLKDPTLSMRFDRATDLMDLGFEEWARLELREIEKRTTNRSYRLMLLDEFARAGDFHRSYYLAEVTFGGEREKDGVEGARNLWAHAFPKAYETFVQRAADRFKVSSYLIWSVMRGESSFREKVRSSAGAIGLMQLIVPTATRVSGFLGERKKFEDTDLESPDTNVTFGTWYLKRLMTVMNGDLPLAVASYNAGPHRIQGWLKDLGAMNLDMDEFIEHIPYLETRNYVKKVLRNYFIYQLVYEKTVPTSIFLAQKPASKFDGAKPTVESWD